MIYIYTLSWNGFDMLDRLKPGLLLNLKETGHDFQWCIKSNGCTDGTVEKVKNWNDPNIKVFEYPDNKMNFAEGCNYLFNQTNPDPDDFVLFLNNDVMMEDGRSLNRMVSLSHMDDVGAVGARLSYPGCNPESIQFCGTVFESLRNLPKHLKAGSPVDDHARQNREFQVLTGACLLTKARILMEIGKLRGTGQAWDNKFIWCYDDVDLTLQISKNLKLKCIMCGQTNMTHGESVTLKQNPVNRLFLHQNIKYFYSIWSGRYEIDEDLYLKIKNYGLISS